MKPDEPADEPLQDDETPAPLLGKLILVAAPFIALVLLFFLDRCIGGG